MSTASPGPSKASSSAPQSVLAAPSTPQEESFYPDALRVNSAGHKYLPLMPTESRRVTLQRVEGSKVVDIRDWYRNRYTVDGRPGRRNVALSESEWRGLKRLMPEIDDALRDLCGRRGLSPPPQSRRNRRCIQGPVTTPPGNAKPTAMRHPIPPAPAERESPPTPDGMTNGKRKGLEEQDFGREREARKPRVGKDQERHYLIGMHSALGEAKNRSARSREAPRSMPKTLKLEAFVAKYEPTCRHFLSASDAEPLSLRDLLEGAAREDRELYEDMILGGAHARGLPQLRTEIARRAFPSSSVQAKHILPCNPVEGLFLALSAILEEKDEVIVSAPPPQRVMELAAERGVKVHLWFPRKDDAGGLLFHPSDFMKKLGVVRARFAMGQCRGLKATILNFPHDPTGMSFTNEALREIMLPCREEGAYFFNDERGRGLERPGVDALPPVATLHEKGVSFGSIGRTLSLSGLRVAWLATRDPVLLQRLALYKDFVSHANAVPSETLAVLGLRQQEPLLERNRNRIHANRELARDFFAQYPHRFRWYEPEGGLAAFPELVFGGATATNGGEKCAKLRKAENIEDFCVALAEGFGVLLLPGSVFNWKARFRLGLGREGFADALAAFRGALAESGLIAPMEAAL